MNNSSILGLNRNIFFTGLTSFFTDTATKMVYSVMPLFLLSLGASKTTISMIEGIAESTASLLKAASGYWSDRIGKHKRFMILGYGITALIIPLYSFVQVPIQVLYLRFTERLGKGLRTAPRDSLISASTSGKNTGKNFGFHKVMDNSGAIIGPLIAMFLLYRFPLNFSNIFLIAAIPALFGVLTIVVFIRDFKHHRRLDNKKFQWADLSKRFYFFLLIIFIFTLGNSTDALLLVKASESGIANIYIPFLYMLLNSVSVFFALRFGKLSDRIGRERLIIAGFLLYSVLYFCFGIFHSFSVFILLFIGYGIYSALTDGIQKAMVSDLVKVELKGTGFGLYHAVLGITLLPASLIAGLLYDRVNSSAPFYFGASMALIAAVLMMYFVSTKNKKIESSKI